MTGSWLDAHAANVTSQNGEDGIIRLVLQMLPERDAWCVDCASGDGWTHSNVAQLVMPPCRYRCLMVEGDEDKAAVARERWDETGRVTCVNRMVSPCGDGGLAAVMSECGAEIPQRFDFLSIDIDGCDLHVWRSLDGKYRPKVVCIEHNPTIATGILFEQPADLSLRHGASLQSIYEHATHIGYRMLAVTRTNAIFVDERYFGRYGIEDDSPRALRSPTLEAGDVTSVFWGYDGEMFVHGPGKCPWKSCGERDCSDAVDFLNGDPSVVAEAV